MVAPMSKRRCGVGVTVLNDLLYAVGELTLKATISRSVCLKTLKLFANI